MGFLRGDIIESCQMAREEAARQQQEEIRKLNEEKILLIKEAQFVEIYVECEKIANNLNKPILGSKELATLKWQVNWFAQIIKAILDLQDERLNDVFQSDTLRLIASLQTQLREIDVVIQNNNDNLSNQSFNDSNYFYMKCSLDNFIINSKHFSKQLKTPTVEIKSDSENAVHSQKAFSLTKEVLTKTKVTLFNIYGSHWSAKALQRQLHIQLGNLQPSDSDIPHHSPWCSIL